MGHTTNQSQIVTNQANNFSLYYNVLNYFKTIMKNHPSINVVTQGDIFSIDTKEFPQYPLGNVIITDAAFGEKTTDYSVQLIVADKTKLKNNESSGSWNQQTIDFQGVDDTVDVHANTLAILNDLTSYTQYKVEGFEIIGDINCEAFKERFDNGLAGWSATFTLRVHNDKNRCLFFLINPSGEGYIIQDCDSGEHYLAVMKEGTQVEIGQIFQSITTPSLNPRNWLETYRYLRCFEVLEPFENRDNYDFVNLPVLAIPFEDFNTCEYCDLWKQPKVWSTTPAYWGKQPGSEIRKWQYL